MNHVRSSEIADLPSVLARVVGEPRLFVVVLGRQKCSGRVREHVGEGWACSELVPCCSPDEVCRTGDGRSIEDVVGLSVVVVQPEPVVVSDPVGDDACVGEPVLRVGGLGAHDCDVVMSFEMRNDAGSCLRQELGVAVQKGYVRRVGGQIRAVVARPGVSAVSVVLNEIRVQALVQIRSFLQAVPDNVAGSSVRGCVVDNDDVERHVDMLQGLQEAPSFFDGVVADRDDGQERGHPRTSEVV